MTASLPPMIKFQPLVAGVPLPGGKVYFYAAGTSTPQAAYAADGTTPLANPLILDANGSTTFRLGSTLSYKINLLTSDDVQVVNWPQDNVTGLDGVLIDLASTDPGKGAALVAFLQSGAGAVARTVQDKGRESISLFDYMSAAQIADVLAYSYTLDVSVPVQNAINGANGREVLAPAGGYLIENTLTYFNATGTAKIKGLKIRGEGIGNTIFKNEVVSGPMIDINTGVGATALNYFFSYSGILQGFTILGNAAFADSDGIRFRSCWNYNIDNVLIDSCTRYGIHVANDTGISPDYTASANMRLTNVRIVGCKKGIYQPYGNGWPLARLENVDISSNTDIGVEANSTYFHWIQGSCAYNGSAYSGDGTPNAAYGGILFGSSDNYVSKGVTIDSVEMDDNTPQQVWMYNAKSPVIRGCSVVSRITAGYLNKYDFVFGRDTASTYCDDVTIVSNNFQLPTTLASTGLTHHFVYTKAYTRGGFLDINGYSIAGGTAGTEFFYIKEDAKASSFNVAKWRTKFIAQNGDQTRSAYAVQYDGSIPISRLSILDDTAISLKPLSVAGALLVTFNAAAAYTAIIGYDISGGKTFILTSGSTGIDIKAVSTVLTGTDGTDGKTTVSVDATSGKIYIENRLGSTLTLTVQIMEGFGNWL